MMHKFNTSFAISAAWAELRKTARSKGRENRKGGKIPAKVSQM